MLLAHERCPGGFERGVRDAEDALQVGVGLDQPDERVAAVAAHDEVAEQVAQLVDWRADFGVELLSVGKLPRDMDSIWLG